MLVGVNWEAFCWAMISYGITSFMLFKFTADRLGANDRYFVTVVLICAFFLIVVSFWFWTFGWGLKDD